MENFCPYPLFKYSSRRDAIEGGGTPPGGPSGGARGGLGGGPGGPGGRPRGGPGGPEGGGPPPSRGGVRGGPGGAPRGGPWAATFSSSKPLLKLGVAAAPGGGPPPPGGSRGGIFGAYSPGGQGGVPRGGAPRGRNMAKKGQKRVIFSGFEPNFAQNRSHLCSIYSLYRIYI